MGMLPFRIVLFLILAGSLDSFVYSSLALDVMFRRDINIGVQLFLVLASSIAWDLDVQQ